MNRTEALEYTRKFGLSTLPLAEGTKVCYQKGDRSKPEFREVKDNENLGVVMGETLGGDYVVCFDFDGEDDTPIKNFKKTLIVQSSPGHYHYYYFIPFLAKSAHYKERGLDVIGCGSYVVFPSSQALNKRGTLSTYEDNGKDIAYLSLDELKAIEALLNVELQIPDTTIKRYHRLLNEIDKGNFPSRSHKDAAIVCSMISHGKDKEYIRKKINNSVYYKESKFFSREGSNYFETLYERAYNKIHTEWPVDRAKVISQYTDRLTNNRSIMARLILKTLYHYALVWGKINKERTLLTFSLSIGEIADLSGVNKKTIMKYLKGFYGEYLWLEQRGTRLISNTYALKTDWIDFNLDPSDTILELLNKPKNRIAVHDAFRIRFSKSFQILYPYLLKDSIKVATLAKQLNINQGTCRAILYRFEEFKIVERIGKSFRLIIRDLGEISNTLSSELLKRNYRGNNSAIVTKGLSVISLVKTKINSFIHRNKIGKRDDRKYDYIRINYQVDHQLCIPTVSSGVLDSGIEEMLNRMLKFYYLGAMKERKYCME